MVVQQPSTGNLDIGAHVVAEAQRLEGIHAVLVHQLRPRRDGVLGGVRRRAVARADGIVLVVVVPHHPRHRRQIHHFPVVPAEDLRARRVAPRHRLRLPLLHLRGVPARLVDRGEVRDVVGGPVALAAQPPRHVRRLPAAGDLLEDPEGPVPRRLPGEDAVVVQHHPLVVVKPAVVQRVHLHPALRRAIRQLVTIVLYVARR